MAGIQSKNTRLTTTPCTRTHQIGALALVISTFFITRLLCDTISSSLSNVVVRSGRYNENDAVQVLSYGSVSWPSRGFRAHLSLKVYVYDENEIDGLKLLLYGRDGKISPDSCVKGQWGTQVVLAIKVPDKKQRGSRFFLCSGLC